MLTAKIIIGKSPVSTNADGLISLTDLWKAAGGANRNHPTKWLSNDGTKEFLNHLGAKLRVQDSELIQIIRGRGKTQGTYAHWQVALAFAKYLSPELHMAVNEVFMRYKAGDPTLAEEVIEKVEDPAALERIERRARAKKQYKQLASVVFAKGGHRKTIAQVADTNNLSVTGFVAQDLKYVRGGKEYLSSREVYTSDELAQVAFLESLESKAMSRSKGGHDTLISIAQSVATEVSALAAKYAA